MLKAMEMALKASWIEPDVLEGGKSIDFVSLLVLMRSGTWVPPGAAFP